MKKTLFLFVLVALGTTSCKKESAKPDDEQPGGGIEVPNPPPAEVNSLPKSVVFKFGQETYTYTFNYVQGTRKLHSIVKSNGNVETYEYDGDFIKKISYNDQDYKTYRYENQLLVEEISYRYGTLQDKIEFVRDGSQKLILNQYEFSDGEWVRENTINLEFDNMGNLFKGGTEELNVNLEYDKKNTPGLNITGISKVNFLGGVPMGDNIDFSDVVGRRNNPTIVNINMLGIPLQTIKYVYEYGDSNHANFPTKITGTRGDETFSATVTYQ